MAIGVIVGSAFGKITSSLVNDILMPALGFAVGRVDFGKLKWEILKEKLDASGSVVSPSVIITYGNFIQVFVDFIIIAFCMFLVGKGMNAMKRKAEDNQDVSIPTPKDIELLGEIRDLLKASRK